MLSYGMKDLKDSCRVLRHKGRGIQSETSTPEKTFENKKKLQRTTVK
jgi:hypothetical protein